MIKKRRQMLLALLAVGALAAGCGGDDGGEDDDVASMSDDESSDDSAEEEGGGGDPEAALTEWASCMQDEGVDLPDPTQDEDGNWVIEAPGISIGGDEAGLSSDSGSNDDGPDEPPIDPEEMMAAEETCGPPPGIGEFTEEDDAEFEANALEFAECMREEGIEDFPDPDFSDQGPGGAPQVNEGDAGEEGDSGSGPESQVNIGPFGEIDLDDPATASAFEACEGELGGPEIEGGPRIPESDGAGT
jgi:hypothetical protein